VISGEAANTNLMIYRTRDEHANYYFKDGYYKMNDNWLWTWRVYNGPVVVMLINAIDLV